MNIRFRLILGGVGSFVLLLVLFISTVVGDRAQRGDELLLNLTGRQRTLGVKLTSEALQWALAVQPGSDPAQAQAALALTSRIARTAGLFAETQAALRVGGEVGLRLDGSERRMISRSDNGAYQEALARVGTAWDAHRLAVVRLMATAAGSAREAALAEVLRTDTALLDATDAATATAQGLGKLRSDGVRVFQVLTILLGLFLVSLILTVGGQLGRGLLRLTRAAQQISQSSPAAPAPGPVRTRGPREIVALAAALEQLRLRIVALGEKHPDN